MSNLIPNDVVLNRLAHFTVRRRTAPQCSLAHISYTRV